MTITIDYITYEIHVPKAQTTFVEFDAITGREKRQLDLDAFWKALADVQDDPTDVWAPTAFINTPPQNLGAFTLGRSVVIQSPYTVTFEDGNYSVNLINGNSNVQNVTTVNSVQVLPNNTGGLVQVTSGSGVLPADIVDISAAVWNKLAADHVALGSFGKLMGTMELMLDELHKIQGLDASNPLTMIPTQRSAGSVTLDVTGDGENLSVVTRQ